VRALNADGHVTTAASCCGHGVYPPTIIVKIKGSGEYIEIFSKKRIRKPKRHRFYILDRETGCYRINENLIIKE
jgi:hypothetical protein